MKKIFLISVALFAFTMVSAETKTVILDGRNLTDTETTEETSIEQENIKYIISKGAKAIKKPSTSATEFSDVTKCILIGQKSTYIYNQTPFGTGITKFEIYTNTGSISTAVTTEISFSETPITNSTDSKIEIGTPTKDAIKEIENIPEKAKYFYWTVTSSHNAQVAFRITYELESEPEATPVENVSDKVAETTKKVLENGQIIILTPEGKKYNIGGQAIQ